MKQLILPPNSESEEKNVEIDVTTSVVIVGANGTGKTRLGVWIELESAQNFHVHRISAQRALMMPESTRPDVLDKATPMLIYGHADGLQLGARLQRVKVNTRWSSKPATSLLNDYEHLMNVLFAEDYEISTRFRQELHSGHICTEIPTTKLDIIKTIWSYVLPHRKLDVGGGKIETYALATPDSKYNGSDMSDGERVIFYLVGQCLCAPENSIIIIDEPEIHIHKSVQARLWDSLETQRKDCMFVYLTHDLDFAATRVNATKLCINSYTKTSWDWYIVPESEDLPESIFLEVLGSRKTVLFIEGDKGSLDEKVYRIIYPNMTIRPVGSWSKVVAATKTFNDYKEFHWLNAFGMIDCDHRGIKELEYLRECHIYSPPVAEVENIFLMEDVMMAVAKQMKLSDAKDKVEEAKQFVLSEFKKKIDYFASQKVAQVVEQTLKGFPEIPIGREMLITQYKELFDSINVEILYAETVESAMAMIDAHDYEGIIRSFNDKGLVKQIGRFFNVKPNYYVELAIQVMQSDEYKDLNHIRESFPSFAANTLIKTVSSHISL